MNKEILKQLTDREIKIVSILFKNGLNTLRNKSMIIKYRRYCSKCKQPIAEYRYDIGFTNEEYIQIRQKLKLPSNFA